MKIGELFAEIGIKADTKQLDNFERGLKSAAKSATKLATVATGVGLAIAGMIKITTSQSIAFKNFAVQTDLSITKLQQLGFWATKNDITMSETISTLESMNQAMAAIKLGTGGNLAFFTTTGIDLDQDQFAILEDFQKAMQNWDPGIAANIGARLGINPKFLNILRQSSFQMHSLNKEFILTGKQRDKLLELNRAFKGYLFILRNVGDQIMSMNTGPLLLLIEFLTHIANGTKKVVEKFKDLWDSSEKLRLVLLAVGIAFGLLVFPKLSTFVLLATVFEDIAVWLGKGDSIIGPFIKKMDFLPTIKEVKRLITELEKLLALMGIKDYKDIQKKIGPPLRKTAEVVDKTMLTVSDYLLTQFSKLGRLGMETFQLAVSHTMQRMEGMQPNNNPVLSNISNSKNVTVGTVNISIDGSPTPNETAEATYNKLTGIEYDRVYYSLNSGDSS